MKRRRNVRRRNGTAPSCLAPNRRRRVGGAETYPTPIKGPLKPPEHHGSMVPISLRGAPIKGLLESWQYGTDKFKRGPNYTERYQPL